MLLGPAAAGFLLVTACAAPGRHTIQDPRAGEPGRPEVTTRKVITPLFGWGRSETTRFHYVLPFYYHESDTQGEQAMDLFFPLLSAGCRGPVGKEGSVRGAVILPLLAFAGSGKRGGREGAGWLAPYLAAGSVSYREGEGGTTARGAELFPWLPLVNDLFSFHLYTTAKGAGEQDTPAARDALGFPVLGLGLFRGRSAGIEEEQRFLYLWSTSLSRHVVDLPGGGFTPGGAELDATELLRDAAGGPDPCTGAGDPAHRRLARLAAIARTSRSGAPLEHTGVLDPLLTLEVQGEGLRSLGMEPLLFYDREEGVTLAPLLLTFGSKGVRFGGPAFRHLYPLVHGNREGTRYDFLAGLGTWMEEGAYAALDVKLLFNWQAEAGRGYTWGILPYVFGRRPARPFRRDVRFLQFPCHLVAGWRVGDYRGLEVAPPFLFSWVAKGKERRFRFLLFFRFSSTAEESAFDLLGLTLHRWRKGEAP